MPFVDVAQVVGVPSTDENLIKLQAKVTAKAIGTFDEGISQ